MLPAQRHSNTLLAQPRGDVMPAQWRWDMFEPNGLPFIELRPDMRAHRRHSVKYPGACTFSVRFARHDFNIANGTAGTMRECVDATTFCPIVLGPDLIF